VGLLCVVGWNLGLHDVNPVGYPTRPDGTFLTQFKEHLIPKRPQSAEPGDILVFAESGHPCHCGILSIYYGKPGVIHAHAGVRKVTEQTLESAQSIVGRPIMMFSFPNIEN
jgi:hypothetical protein